MNWRLKVFRSKKLFGWALLLTLSQGFIVQGVYAGSKDYQELSVQEIRALKDRQAAMQNALVTSDDSASPCVFINSTKLRRMIIKNDIEKGMMASDVIKARGKPAVVNRDSGGMEQWVYQYSDSSRYLYFRDGCLASWN